MPLFSPKKFSWVDGFFDRSHSIHTNKQMSLRIYFLFSACLLAVEKCLIHIGEKWDLCSSASSSLCGFFLLFPTRPFFSHHPFYHLPQLARDLRVKYFPVFFYSTFLLFFGRESIGRIDDHRRRGKEEEEWGKKKEKKGRKSRKKQKSGGARWNDIRESRWEDREGIDRCSYYSPVEKEEDKKICQTCVCRLISTIPTDQVISFFQFICRSVGLCAHRFVLCMITQLTNLVRRTSIES